MFDSITNSGEFFSNHYLDSVIGGDLGDLRSSWDAAEGKGEPSARSLVKSMASDFFKARATASEATGAGHSDSVKALNDVVLRGFGFTPNRQVLEFKRNTVDLVTIPVAASIETSTGLLLVAIDAGFAKSADDLFDVSSSKNSGQSEGASRSAGLLLDEGYRESDKRAIRYVADAVAECFSVDEPPRFVLVVGGRVAMLAERSKWPEGRYLAVDLDLALERNNAKAKGELEIIATLFGADSLVPGGVEGSGSESILDELVDKSSKHAVGVSKELRNGIRESIEIIANEVIEQRDNKARAAKLTLFTRTAVDATELTRQSLRYLYRLLVLLYAESRPELGILPVRDEAYMEGYSLDRLRDLCQVDLDTDAARNGSHFNDSLAKLFDLVNRGTHRKGAQQQMDLAAPTDGGTGNSTEQYLDFPGLDAQLFDEKSTALVTEVTLRNEALQRVLHKLMLAEGKKKGDSAGFISYAQLGINQLGAVYEGLMAYTGFYADQDLYEVAKDGDPSDGTWMVPSSEAAQYPDEVFVTRPNPHTQVDERVLHTSGSFVFRLAGRDRQRSASYYTPEVLTRSVVKHSLAELLGLDDYAPANGSSGITEATQMLDLMVCEPALGSGAFLNEAINQLAEEYLKRRQAELGETLDPERLSLERQRVKAHFALNQSYGVDLNPTAVELAEVSLWLNAMYKGLEAPWFGLRLRSGNSLIGCRRSTWKASQLGNRPWAQTKKDKLQPPTDRPLSKALSLTGDHAEIHHFLLPGHGWAGVATRKEAKELRPEEVEALRNWRKTILAAPKKTDAKRLAALAAGVETMWASASERVRLIQVALHRPIDLYGYSPPANPTSISREKATKELENPDSSLGRLRTLMDAWVGLWFWPLDSDERPPSWGEWLSVAEAIVRPETQVSSEGQLDLFDDLDDLDKAELERASGQKPMAVVIADHAWLGVALAAAQREGVFHWKLEFAPVFRRGGFDLQVGNPPWVRPRWYEDLVLAEDDPWWGVTKKPGAAAIKARRAQNLTLPAVQANYLAELASSEGVVEFLGSPVERPLLAGIQTNLYMLFMDTVWRHASDTGISGLLHPESHFTDPKAGALRRATYGRLRRHWQFLNGLFLFEDIHDMNTFGVHIYCTAGSSTFMQMSSLQHPAIVDQSLVHDGSGQPPSLQYPQGGWDLRPHRARVLTITEEVLTDWAKLFDEPGTPAAEARLLRPVTTADLDALSVLAAQPVRLADHDYHWTRGHEEDRAKTDGTIVWDTKTPTSWDDVILQGPHFSVATPFNKQPNPDCKHNQDYSEWDLEHLPERVIPRTNYQRAVDPDTYQSRLDHWNGRPATTYWRFAWRRMTQPGLERSLQNALLPPGPTHVNTCFALSFPDVAHTAALSGLWSSLPYDYLIKVSGKADVQDQLIYRTPTPFESPFLPSLIHRILRLNCLTRDYAPLWEELFDPSWQSDSWTGTSPQRQGVGHLSHLGDISAEWTMETPLRRDWERRQALVELDALAALMLGLSAEQLCAMYRTQFAVLRKYEYKMVFDSEGRKICGYHQSAGYRQAELQAQAKEGDLPKDWKNLWKLYEKYEDDPTSVDWLGHYHPPFTRADRESEMTRAYNTFQSRLGPDGRP